MANAKKSKGKVDPALKAENERHSALPSGQLGLGDVIDADEPQPEPETQEQETPKQEEQQAVQQPQLTNVQLLDASFQNFLTTHYIPMFELVGLFELKLVEFKEAWRLQVSGDIQKNMDAAREAQQNGNAH